MLVWVQRKLSKFRVVIYVKDQEGFRYSVVHCGNNKTAKSAVRT